MNKKGFTLIEVLLVVAIIAILAGIVILAINPTKQLGDANEARQQADVTTILDGVYQYSIDNAGALPATISSGAQVEICATGTAPSTCTSDGLVDLSDLTVNETYLVAIPVDPEGASTNGAGYTISKTDNGRLKVESADGGVSATR